MSITTEAPTLTPISRAEAIRRFKAATHVTVIARSFRGMDTPNQGDGKPVVGVRRRIERVTTTGVYYWLGENEDRRAPYASTRFNDGHDPKWQEDAEGHLILTTHSSQWERADGANTDQYITREHARITYKLETLAGCDPEPWVSRIQGERYPTPDAAPEFIGTHGFDFHPRPGYFQNREDYPA